MQYHIRERYLNSISQQQSIRLSLSQFRFGEKAQVNSCLLRTDSSTPNSVSLMLLLLAASFAKHEEAILLAISVLQR